MSGSTPGSVASSSSTWPGSSVLMAWAGLMTGSGHCRPLQSRTCDGVSVTGIGTPLLPICANSHIASGRSRPEPPGARECPPMTVFDVRCDRCGAELASPDGAIRFLYHPGDLVLKDDSGLLCRSCWRAALSWFGVEQRVGVSARCGVSCEPDR